MYYNFTEFAIQLNHLNADMIKVIKINYNNIPNL
jgi:hypothetical protein